MQNILAPTDFSNNAYNALFYATQLLKQQSCTFHICNAYNEFTPLQSRTSNRDLLHQLNDESIEGLQNAYHKIRLDDDKAEHTFKTISKKEELIPFITQEIEGNDIDLVVMGNKGCSEVEAILFGSNTLRAISTIRKCPILTVPKEIDFNPPKEIAFVTDYARPYDAGLLHPLLFMAKQYGSKIRVMHINDTGALTRGQKINQGILLEYLKPFYCTEHWMPLYKSKATVVHDFLDEMNIDLLAMVNYEHGFFEKITHEPVIKRIAFNTDIPFLIIPAAD